MAVRNKIIIGIVALLLLTIFIASMFDLFKNSGSNLTIEKATQMATQMINQTAPVEMAIKNVVAKSTGWIFYYDSAEAVKTGNWQTYGIPGNNALFVGKDGTTRFIPNPNDPVFQSE